MALKLTISEPEAITLKISSSGGDYPPYDGDYIVTPGTYDEVILPTAQKLMKEDVEVKVIPRFEVSNPSGGETLIIGKEYFTYGD